MIPHPVSMSYEGVTDVPSGLLRQTDEVRYATLRLSDRGLAPAILAAVDLPEQAEAFAQYLSNLSSEALLLAASIRRNIKENAA